MPLAATAGGVRARRARRGGARRLSPVSRPMPVSSIATSRAPGCPCTRTRTSATSTRRSSRCRSACRPCSCSAGPKRADRASARAARARRRRRVGRAGATALSRRRAAQGRHASPHGRLPLQPYVTQGGLKIYQGGAEKEKKALPPRTQGAQRKAAQLYRQGRRGRQGTIIRTNAQGREDNAKLPVETLVPIRNPTTDSLRPPRPPR